MSEAEPILRIQDLHVTRNGAPRAALERFSLALEPGETVVLLGETGCGKEALMRVLGGLAESGEQISGTLQFGASAPERAGRKLHHALRIAYLPGPQARPLSPNATVASQLVRVLTRKLGAPASSARAELELALSRMPAAPTLAALDRPPDALHAEIMVWGLFALAFAQTPELVLADHPLAGIAPSKRRVLVEALKAEQKRLGFTLLYASMGTGVAPLLDGRIVVMRHGRIVEEGHISRLAGNQTHAYTRTLFQGVRASEPMAARAPGRGEPVLQIYGLELPRPAGADGAPAESLTFELRRGAALALVGEEGSGRRSLARQMIGLKRARAGRIVLDAVDIGILTETMLRRLRRRIAYITGDDNALDPRMTIWDTVGEPLRAHLNLPREIVAGYREAALKRVGLASLPGSRAVAALSPFDKRRLQVARAIVTAPLLAVLDEPLAGLDAFAQSVMRDLLKTFRAEEGPALILITADFSIASALAESGFVFNDGRIVERGPIAQLMQEPKDEVTRTLVEAVRSLVPDGLSRASAEG